MSELYRVLNVDGIGIFQVPMKKNVEITYEDFSITSEKERKIAFGQKDQVRWYGKDYKERLENVGFHISINPLVKKFIKEEQFQHGFLSNEYIYSCTKK
jgi:hypothetical protein